MLPDLIWKCYVARSLLRRRCTGVLCRLLVVHQSLRPSVRKRPPPMDYIIGGITTLFLFAYLIYALLKPEKF